MSLDELDKQIIAILNADGRENNNEIAKKLSVSEGTIRNRIKKLTSAGILKVSGQINPDAEPEKQLVFLGVKIAVSKDLIATAEKISKLKEVQSAYITTGRYDIIVEAWVEVKYGLINFLSGPMARIEGIVSTESFLIMNSSNKWVSP
jgi:Lrp/AsnC family transcriptional regulator for asnA, asnC and gidA